jgi:hypothetical protein
MLNDYLVCKPRMVIMYVPSFEFGNVSDALVGAPEAALTSCSAFVKTMDFELVNFDPVVQAKLVVVRRHESYM